MGHSVILTVGFPGSGKSTVAKAIASNLNATYLDKDTICNGFTGLLLELNGEPANARDDSALYKEKIMPVEYRTLFQAANDTLSSSQCIVIDAPFVSFFNDRSYIKNQCEILNWIDVTIIVVEVSASLDVTKERLIQRGEERDLWKLDNWNTFSQRISSQRCHWEGVTRFSFDNSSLTPNVIDLVQMIKSTL
ncbi:ATP-binding protein [Marinomonas rhizomae]|uniref:Putative kinase n=1 Tax=Marinomonas rhizomae TaxID=491948 RepID=A0A366IXU0_9GAMM|nr:ATP-binding protein [Marinomonas rhizomae]RBP79621.1 putative kinase [Marinomonas rhizomae]RNF71617.1 ATP-binding protein [Marinomonas rhizomae]